MKRTWVGLLLMLTLPGLALAHTTRHGWVEHDVRQIERACKLFRAEYGAFPPNNNWLAELTGSTNAIVNFHRIRFVSLDSAVDRWGTPFVYRCPGLNRPDSVDVYSLGEDGKTLSGGNDPDDINSWDGSRPWLKHYRRPVVTSVRLSVVALGLILAGVVIISRSRRRSG